MDSEEVLHLVKLIRKEIKTPGMNFSAFCQYFNIHNVSYSVFRELDEETKLTVLQFMISYYLEDRHPVYVSHGYSNAILQVMCDSYAHKRKGEYGKKKVADTLNRLGIKDLAKEKVANLDEDTYYLLADKTGKKLFQVFAKKYGVTLSKEGRKTKKFPDALIKIGKRYFIVEHKTMKEDGGGQDKQTNEITDFIFKKPEFEDLHYVTYIEGIYFNGINEKAHAKKGDQYKDIVGALTSYPENYFVNQAGFEKLILDALNER